MGQTNYTAENKVADEESNYEERFFYMSDKDMIEYLCSTYGMKSQLFKGVTRRELMRFCHKGIGFRGFTFIVNP